ncbi:extracellular solute-binding protein [Azospirillum sp. TSO22-1]|uniref:extracellular solute-binding protein n=1 Tax=Azospirillum sp. TSO22-1 TaxID=716789 RepID=UPI000D620455|nr:extracellular solute-binding protein [Azospirillum sp. TSO22-1]PWC44843.1 peptide ABC transporter substrate-binding protein [Azospirillum sp. TSO22-1]
MRTILAALILVASALPAAAEPAHGIAMHGDLKYPAGFKHYDYVNPDASRGGTLRQAVVGTFDTLNPYIVKGIPPSGLSAVYETLLARAQDEPFSLYGLLAESVEVPDDRSSVVFRLNPKARWHDGTPVTADDVLFSYEVQRQYGTPNRRLFYAKVALAEKLDGRTVRFAFLREPDGGIDREMPMLMGLLGVQQKAWWQGRTFDRTTLDPPPGSGPYRIRQVEPGRRIVYERAADYWGRDLPVRRGQNNFDALVYDYYRDDTVALEAFKAGQADVRRESEPGKWATGYEGPALRAGKIVLEELATGRPEYARGFILNARRPLFRDRKVRQALGYAVDFAWINRTHYHGALKRTASFYPNSALAATGLPGPDELKVLEPFRPILPPEVFTTAFTLPQTDGSGPYASRANQREALRLLAEAGWTIQNGKLLNGAGRPFVFEILLGDPADERPALEFARGLERLGITAKVRTVDSAQFQARLDEYDYDVVSRWWSSTLSPGNEQVYYYGSKAADTPGTRNYAGIKDPAVDALAASIASARTRPELEARVKALDRVLLWGFYMVPLFHSPVDRIARWSGVQRPPLTPVYGAMTETWWRE